MTSSEMCPSHVTLTLTLFVQGHTVFYVLIYLPLHLCLFFFHYVAALQYGHTAFSSFLSYASSQENVMGV